jgi:hypothetical protein
VQVKQELEEKLQETQCSLDKEREAVMVLQKELADAASTANAAKAQHDSHIAAMETELTQSQDTMRTCSIAAQLASLRSVMRHHMFTCCSSLILCQ